jgi:hypothetical protein
MNWIKRLFGGNVQKERVQDLAALMLPTLLARRFDLGMGGRAQEEFVQMALDLADQIVTRKTEKGPRTLIQEKILGAAHQTNH